MNDRQLKELESEITNIIRKYNLDDTVLISNKVIIRNPKHNDAQIMGSVMAGLENIVVDVTCRTAENILFNDYDEAYDRMVDELNAIFAELKRRVKTRVEKVKKIKLKYN
jgi:hypothetical protein